MKRQKGHAMIELAVSAGVMVTFLAGTFQFGYTFYIYNQLVNAVGNGARYAAQRTYRAATDRDVERGTQAVRNLVVYGDPQAAADAAPVVANLKPANVEVHWILGGDGSPAAVNVAIHGFAVDAAIQAFPFEGRPSVEFPYVGRYAPGESEP